MTNREFLMLAHPYDATRDDITGWCASEKLDGFRAFWDGGITAGKRTKDVPWANLDRGYRAFATGLWSRYGNVVCAPDWWTAKLPKNVPLDGEVWMGYDKFELTRSICSRHEPDRRWQKMRFMAFDAPTYQVVFTTGRINNPNFKKIILRDDCLDYINHNCESTCADTQELPRRVSCFYKVYDWMLHNLEPNDVLSVVPQRQIDTAKDLKTYFDTVVDRGGEGLVLRCAASYWTPKRKRDILKYKPLKRDTAIVKGFVAANEGKDAGLIGAVIVSWHGKSFKLSGFTQAESASNDPNWCSSNPGCVCPEDVSSLFFQRGTEIRFKYTALTRKGIPDEARFDRR